VENDLIRVHTDRHDGTITTYFHDNEKALKQDTITWTWLINHSKMERS